MSMFYYRISKKTTIRVIDEKAVRLKIKTLGYFIVPQGHNLLFGWRKVIPVQFGRDNVVVTWFMPC